MKEIDILQVTNGAGLTLIAQSDRLDNVFKEDLRPETVAAVNTALKLLGEEFGPLKASRGVLKTENDAIAHEDPEVRAAAVAAMKTEMAQKDARIAELEGRAKPADQSAKSE